MRILIACEDLRVGGAQVFVLRLANVLRQNHIVTIYSLYPDLIDRELVDKYAPEVDIETPKFFLDQMIRKLDRLFYLLKIDLNIRNSIVARDVYRLIKKKNVDIVHSNMFKCDYVLARALRSTLVPFVVTLHGNYEEFLANYYHETKGEILLGYLKKVIYTIDRIQGLVYLTEKNLRVFQQGLVEENKLESMVLKKIYNGFAGEVSEVIARESLGIADDSTVYGFVARGIPEKGWKTVLDAFILSDHKSDHLILVGWSDYVKGLALNYQYGNIHFVGYSSNPLNWISLMDIGILPSVFHESLPNVIAEYLYLGKAVICTDVGDSKHMIMHKNEYAGFLLNPTSPRLTADLAVCLSTYKREPDLLQAHQKLARKAFEKFRMEVCLASYLDLYQKLVSA